MPLDSKQLISPDEGKLWSVHPWSEGQTGILSKWWDNHSEDQRNKDKTGWQNNLQKKQNVKKTSAYCLFQKKKLFQNIFQKLYFWVPQKKVSHRSLKQHEGE